MRCDPARWRSGARAAAHDGHCWQAAAQGPPPASIEALLPVRVFAAPYDITVTSTAFSDGSAMPAASAGKGVGDNTSPQLGWTGLPLESRQLVLIIDDVDVPLPRPLLHTIAVIESGVAHVDAGTLQPGCGGDAIHPWWFGAPGIRGPPADSRSRATPLPVPCVRA